MTESENLKRGLKLRVGIYREHPVQFKLGHLHLKGRIDRVDLTHAGLEIIDYKTSNIAKTTQKLVLSACQAAQNPKVKLSVQGALYTYGLAHTSFESHEHVHEDIGYHTIKYYSLYFLKNLEEEKNNHLTHNFEEGFNLGGKAYLEIEDEYLSYASRLHQGDFAPKPLQGAEVTCLFCVYKPLCPVHN